MSNSSSGFKHFSSITALIGFGFFTVGLMEPLYDNYITLFLQKYISQTWLIGLIMGIDNVLALILIPVISDFSDKTRTKIGRRMPWIVIMLPIAAILYSFLPYAAKHSLLALVIVIAVLNVAKQSARGPIVALMPDCVPPEFRSQANGVINTIGNIAGITGTLILAQLMDWDTVLPILGETKNTLPFPLVGLLVIIATILLFTFVKEKDRSIYADDIAKDIRHIKITQNLKFVIKGTITRDGKQDQSCFFVLISIFLWFLSYHGLAPFMAVYSIETFNISTGSGSLAAGMVAIAGMIFAIPMGYAGSKWGRKKMIRLSLVVIIVTLFLQIFVLFSARAADNPSQHIIPFLGLYFIFGIFWICIIANSFPILWQMAGFSKIGLYTGLYYTFSQAAAIIAPFLSGLIIDIVGYEGLFIHAATFFILACLTMGLVRGGEKFDREDAASTNNF